MIQAAFCSFVFWWSLYFSVFKLFDKERFRVTRKSSVEEFYCRIVTLFHAVLVALVSISSVFINQTWPFREPAGPNLPSQNAICIFSLGYFLFDLHWCLYHRTEGWFMLFHHLSSILCFGTSLYRGIYGDEIIATLFAMELTNPLLQLRWFLLNVTWTKSKNKKEPIVRKRKVSECDFEFIEKGDVANQSDYNHLGTDEHDGEVITSQNGKEDSLYLNENNMTNTPDKLEISNAVHSPTQTLPKEKRIDILIIDLIFFSLFTVMRVIIGTIYFGVYQSSTSPDLLARFGSTIIYFIGLVFWFRIVGYLLTNYFKKPQMARK